MGKVKVKGKEFEVSDADEAMILAIQELTFAIKGLKNAG